MYHVRREFGLYEEEIKNYTGRDITIAIIDTGISKHPDFGDRVIAFKDFTTDINHMHDCYDDSSHGTHVAGILAGNGYCSKGKWRGIAYRANLVIAKVLDENGDGEIKNLLRAINWIIQTKEIYATKIVNISMGIGELDDERLQNRAIKGIESMWDAGLVVVTAAGNRGPAKCTISPLASSKKVITVGCYEGNRIPYNKNSCEYHSGRGPTKESNLKPDIVTTGTNITSCNSEWARRGSEYRNAYCKKTGTSMATPIVSGACALLLEKSPYLSNYVVKQKLIYSAIDCGEDWFKQGFGRLDIQRLLQI